VCPRFRIARSPRSYGSLRQTAALNAAQRLSGEQPGLHDLGHALEPLGRGQRRQERGIDDRPRGPVERADEVLALRQVDRRLAADGRIDLGEQGGGHGYPCTSPQVHGRREPRRIGRAAAAERQDGAVAADAKLAPEPLDGPDRLRRLAERELVRRREPVAERELRVGAVDPRDVRIRDERDRPFAGDELAETGRSSPLDDDPGRGQDDVVRVAGHGVGHGRVERRAERVAPPELHVVPGERPAAALHPRPGRVDVDVEMDDEDVERVEQLPGLDRAAPDGDHARAPASRGLADEARLDLAEGGLSPLREEIPDPAVCGLDLVVDVVERPPEPGRDLAADGRLAGSHEADEHEVAFKCGVSKGFTRNAPSVMPH
jgi:hypothetical protein